MDLNINTVHISSQDQLTPSNIQKWNEDGVRLIIIDGPPEPVPLKVNQLMEEVNKYLIEKEAQQFECETPSKEDILDKRQQHRYASNRHSFKNYKR